MPNVSVLIARARVILTASITFVLVALPFLIRLEGELGQLGFVSPTITQWLARAITVLAAAAALISTHMPVARSQYGLLPPHPSGMPSPRGDAGDVSVQFLLLVVSVVLLAALGCAGAEWWIHGHKSLIVALAGFAAACWVASGLSWPRKPSS